MGDVAGWICLTILIILFIGEPDLYDKLMSKLDEPQLTTNKE